MDDGPLITQQKAKSPIAEAYRTLRSNLKFTMVDGMQKSLMFTSTGPGEGKSTTAANTAVVLAQNGKRVVLVDFDLRKPVQHRLFGLSSKGVTNILAENVSIASVLQNTMVKNLQVLAAGPIAPNPAELLDSAKLDCLLDELKRGNEYVLIDVPPVLVVTDAGILASKVDGIVMVIASQTVRPQLAQRAKEQLLQAHGKLVGVVLNRVEARKDELYYHYYYQNPATGEAVSRLRD